MQSTSSARQPCKAEEQLRQCSSSQWGCIALLQLFRLQGAPACGTRPPRLIPSAHPSTRDAIRAEKSGSSGLRAAAAASEHVPASALGKAFALHPAAPHQLACLLHAALATAAASLSLAFARVRPCPSVPCALPPPPWRRNPPAPPCRVLGAAAVPAQGPLSVCCRAVLRPRPCAFRSL